ncbi:MAG: ABC transporter ATP-binding protein [Streptosporangiaceae bacterium]
MASQLPSADREPGAAARTSAPPAPAAAAGIAELGREAAAGVPRDADAMIACDRLVRIFATDGIEVQALQGLDLLVAEGELTAIVGASGSGKSTLMNILAALDVPTAGSVRVAGHDLTALTPRERTQYRRSAVGFVWQQAERNLLPYLTAAQNVLMPMQFSAVPRRIRGRRAGELLDLFGVAYCADRTPAMMSGGEQQRVAIATAMANEPAVLLADEPTGELDSETTRTVVDALRTANTELGVTILVVTHDPMLSGQVRRTVAIRDGRTSSETLRRHDADTADAPALAVEYALVDRAGRIQLPRDMLDGLHIRERVRLEAEPDHIGVWPDIDADPQG